MQKIKLYHRIHTAYSDIGVVYVSFYVNREKVHFSTRVTCDKSDWNAEKMIVKKSDQQADDKNLVISNIIARVNNVFVKYRLRDKKLTRASFLRYYNKPTDFNDFHQYCDEKLKLWSKINEYETMQTHKTVIEKLKAFRPQLEFDDITVEFLHLFNNHLKKELKNNDNTCSKNMTILRKYVRRAYKDGYMDEYPFDEFSIRKVRANYEYLNEDELTELIKLYKTGKLEHKLHKTLQLFIFMCLSSLHIGDAKALRIEQFSEENGKFTNLTYYRKKLRNRKPEPVIVPVSAGLQWISKDITGYRKVGPLFEKLPADQTMNRYLGDIANLAEVKKKISHKVGRHTFATIYLKNTKDLPSLKEIMGHSSITETMVYAHVMDSTKEQGIKCFDIFL